MGILFFSEINKINKWEYCLTKKEEIWCIFHFQKRLPFDWISFLMLWYLLDGAALSGIVWKWIWIVSQTVQTNPSPPSILHVLGNFKRKKWILGLVSICGGHWWWPRPWRQQWWWLCCWLRIWQWYFIGNGMLMIFSIRKKCAVAKFVLWPKKKLFFRQAFKCF